MDEIKLIEIKEDIHSENKVSADELREKLLIKKTFLLNLMSSPGAGKTTTLLKTIDGLKHDLKMGIIEADIDSVVDAEKVLEKKIDVVQLRTGGFCHLDARMVEKGLDNMNIDNLDLVVIENVGNLVCPAEFDTGAMKNAMILSIPEGDDKPLKYPLMFTVCDVLLVNKIDVIDHFDFNMTVLRKRVEKLNPDIKIFEISAKTGEGVKSWCEWIKASVQEFCTP
jgi:hydrogenase nickel incorporation protein HypB